MSGFMRRTSRNQLLSEAAESLGSTTYRAAHAVQNVLPNTPVQVKRFTPSIRVCGPKLSLCGCLLSAWGIIQLLVMGLAFQTRSVALLEDLSLNETISDVDDYYAAMEKSYDIGANNCYIAALLYLVTLVVSLHQYWLNSRVTPTGYERYA